MLKENGVITKSTIQNYSDHMHYELILGISANVINMKLQDKRFEIEGWECVPDSIFFYRKVSYNTINI
jgi:hypothetical protein